MPTHTPYHEEEKAGGFTCAQCKKWVVINHFMGTANRNHCNLCLWSKHVDVAKGDRAAECGGDMEPIGLTFKHEGEDKQGEIMLIHQCKVCAKISINRIAGDDEPDRVLEIFEKSKELEEETKKKIVLEKIYLLQDRDKEEVRTQLFGKNL